MYGPGRGLGTFSCRFCFFVELSVSGSCLLEAIIAMLFYLRTGYVRVRARAPLRLCERATRVCRERTRTRTVRVFITFCPAAHAR